jgi:hypothetical protein
LLLSDHHKLAASVEIAIASLEALLEIEVHQFPRHGFILKT